MILKKIESRINRHPADLYNIAPRGITEWCRYPGVMEHHASCNSPAEHKSEHGIGMDPKSKLAIMQVLHLSVGDRWGWISGFTIVKTDSPATYSESRLVYGYTVRSCGYSLSRFNRDQLRLLLEIGCFLAFFRSVGSYGCNNRPAYH